MEAAKTPFSEHIASYVALQRQLGLQFTRQARVLWDFDKYVRHRLHRGRLTQRLAVAYATHNARITSNEAAYRYQFIRRFANYLAVFEPRTPRLDPMALRRTNEQPHRHIYTRQDLSRLLDEAMIISPHAIRGITLFTIVGLAASSGLRVGEIVKLDQTDVDLNSGTLLIRATKFNKQRLVVVHPTTRQVLRRYVAAREAEYAGSSCSAFFINLWRRRFVRHTICDSFRKLAVRAGLRGPTGRGPSFHSLRHTFAVRRLAAWYRAGADVQAMLPTLATYMGHTHYTSTAYYLVATPELMSLGAARVQRGQRAHR